MMAKRNTRINKETLYFERITHGFNRKAKREIIESKKWRNWYLVKERDIFGIPYGEILLNNKSISLPKSLIGKRIRIKIEVIDDGEAKE